MPETSVVQAENLSKTFAGKEGVVSAVEDVSISVEEGEFVALHGPSGCGKSTLLLMLGGLLSPDKGAVRINHQDVYSLPLEARAAFRAKYIGFVFQQFHLIPYLNVLDNVLVSTMAVPDAGARDGAVELLNRFQLSDRLGHVPSKLSVGEQQRVALARALLHKPRVLFADEPTGNLDPENAQIILGAMKQFAAQGGSVLMVTHDETARAAAVRQVGVEQGKLV